MKIAEVYINQLNKNMDRPFDYIIPPGINVEVGERVIVPFTAKDRRVDGIVVKLKSVSEFDSLKPIESVVVDYPKLKQWQIDICIWMKETYHCLFMEAVSCCIPSGLKIRAANANGKKSYYLANSCERQKYYCLSGKYDSKEDYFKEIRSNAFKQRQIIEFLSDEPVLISEIKKHTKCSAQNLKTLLDKGLIREESTLNVRNPYKSKDFSYPKHKLNYHQQLAVDTVLKRGQPSTFLLYGVTGSGKTEVYLRLIEETIKRGKSCLYLVPEISLTSQVVQRIMGRFGKEIGIIHSRLSNGEKIDQWNNINSGEYDIVLGARSAIFAPMDNLGLIILDEEHENTYKSNNRPRYDTREVAKKLQELHNCHVVLGSATPSVVSYSRSLKDEITLLRLPSRINDIPMPHIDVIDMKRELYAGNRSIISRSLYSAINANMSQGGQTILFLNKRGYSSFVFCRSCGYAVNCDNCEVSMTYHHNSKEMVCHYCGSKRRVPLKCPECGSDKIKFTGSGTQKLELILKRCFPKARIVRMDTDSMGRKGAYDEVVAKFSGGEADILLGTQMVTKGFDFKNVTLVGVILADSTLNIPDYKASERTFQLITQVAGRAGRGEKLGRVIVQTYNPDHYSIVYSREHNYEDFYNREIQYRKMMKYPPFSDIIYIGFSDEDEGKAEKSCKLYYDELKKSLETENRVDLLRELFNPTPSPIKKLKNKFRWYFIIKTTRLNEYNKIIYNLNCKKSIMKIDSTKIIDINPNSII